MLSFYIDIALRGWAELLTLLGITGVAVVIPVAVVIVSLVIKCRRGWFEMKTHWIANVRDIAIATVLVWFCLFVWANLRVIYGDHQKLESLTKANQLLRTSNGILIDKLKERPKEVYREKSKTDRNQFRPRLQIIDIKLRQLGQAKVLAIEIKNVGNMEASPAVIQIGIAIGGSERKSERISATIQPGVSRVPNVGIEDYSYELIDSGKVKLGVSVLIEYKYDVNSFEYFYRAEYNYRTRTFSIVEEKSK